MPKRQRYLWVCTNRRPDDNPKGSCAAKESDRFQLALKAAVAEAGLHRSVRVCSSGCIDLCWVGASMAVMPDHAFLGELTLADIPAIVSALGDPQNFADNPLVASKLLKPEQFDEPKKLVTLGVKK